MATEETKQEMIHTKIWYEEPQEDNPFTADTSYCAGYDVYGELLTNASWFEYLYLLFKQEKPASWQTAILEKIAIAIANPGVRDHSVRAAMCAGVGGSTAASTLMAALSVGAGQLNGAREVYTLVNSWNQCGTELTAWQESIAHPPKAKRASVWPECEHVPGFDPHASCCSNIVLQTLDALVDCHPQGGLAWLKQHREDLEMAANSPLSISGVIAVALFDLGFDADQAEMIYLFMRLPGAAVHALEQKQLGWKKYPFFGPSLKITNDPGTISDIKITNDIGA